VILDYEDAASPLKVNAKSRMTPPRHPQQRETQQAMRPFERNMKRYLSYPRSVKTV